MKSFGPPSSHYRSPDFSTIRGARLTDSRIRHYMLAGFYGEDQRQIALAETEKRERKPRVSTKEDLAAALELLASL